MKFTQNTIGALICIAIGFFAGVSISKPIGEVSSPVFEKTESGKQSFTFSPFSEAWKVLHDQYIGKIDEQKLSYGAVAGMIQAAGDPYTAFSDPDATKQFKETLKGSFAGVGAEMGVQDGMIVVIAPLEGSPSQKAGVKAGDIIVAIDGKNIAEDTSLDDAVRMIRGKKGTSVKLAVVHNGAHEKTDISIVRDDIAVPSVKIEMKGNIAHISISNFNSDTADRFTEAARSAKKAGAKGIVLDVRGNPGGYLDASVDIASEFLSPGLPVVIERGNTETIHRSMNGGTLKGLPVVVLINESSASASEILAGALQDDLDTLIIGVKSFGKGSVQDVIDLSDGSSLRVTIAKWFTPNGQSIADEGIVPTIVVKDNQDTKGDEQLVRALDEVHKKIGN